MVKRVKSKPNTQSSAAFHRLNKLPIELRLKIYKYCMVLDRPIEVNYFGFIERFEASSQLLRTCQEVHYDALSNLYGNNKFIVDCFAAVRRFHEVTGNRATARVQHLVLLDWKPFTPLRHDFSVFQPFINLKTLCLTTEIRARAPRSPPAGPPSGTTIPSRETKLLPKILPDIPRTILNLSQTENGLNITLVVIFEMFSRQGYPNNGHWCGRRIDRYTIVATPATRTRNCNIQAGPLGTGYNLKYLSTENTEDFNETFGVKRHPDPLLKHIQF